MRHKIKYKAISIAKPGQHCANEDNALAGPHLIAISDGAGGGGIYADKWSRYLVEHLEASAITSFDALDSWLDSIWEPFYNEYEQKALSAGGLVLQKFYDEGSFATLVAVWVHDECCQWVSYGDSVAFCYRPENGTLQHSFTHLSDFNKPPYLINYKDKLRAKGFRCGTFDIQKGDIVFCASDALSHYILMMYELANHNEYADELQAAERSGSKESTFIKNGSQTTIHFYKDVIRKLMNCHNRIAFELHLTKLYNHKLLALDDYSLAYRII